MDISNKDMPKAGDRNRRKVWYLHIKRKKLGNGTVFAVEVDGQMMKILFVRMDMLLRY